MTIITAMMTIDNKILAVGVSAWVFNIIIVSGDYLYFSNWKSRYRHRIIFISDFVRSFTMMCAFFFFLPLNNYSSRHYTPITILMIIFDSKCCPVVALKRKHFLFWYSFLNQKIEYLRSNNFYYFKILFFFQLIIFL